jgi:hypothetical protein
MSDGPNHPPVMVRRTDSDFGAYAICYAAESLGAEVISVVSRGATWYIYIRTKGLSVQEIDAESDRLETKLLEAGAKAAFLN